MPNDRMTALNNAVLDEIETNAMKTLKTHPRDIIDRALHAVERVYVSKDPDEDAEATKIDAAASLLETCAAALRNGDNPLSLKYGKTKSGDYDGTRSFRIPTQFAADSLIPAAMKDRSAQNRIKAAAKKMAG